MPSRHKGNEVTADDPRRRRPPRSGKMHEKDINYLERNRDVIYARNRKHRIESTWGISVEEYDLRSNGVCPICSLGPQKLFYDHDHTTGAKREFICDRCNRGLGFFLENPEALRKAAAYVDSFRISA